MIANRTIFEGGIDIIPDIVAGDANADLTGDWISLKNYDRAYLLLIKPAGTAGDDLSIHLQQATAAAGTGAKDLTFSRLWHKIATAGGNSFTATGTWTAITLTTATADLDLVSVNAVDLETDEQGAFVLVEVLAESLDADNGFDFVNVIYEGDDIGNSLIINSLWILQGNKYAQDVPLSSLA